MEQKEIKIAKVEKKPVVKKSRPVSRATAKKSIVKNEVVVEKVEANFQKTSFEMKRRLILFGLAIMLVVGLGFGGYYAYGKYKNSKASGAASKQAEENSKGELQSLLDEVGTLMMLPQGEAPQLATVTDQEKLKDKPFFANAQNEDKVLIYVNAKKAILYRPSIGKIVEVMPLTINDQAVDKRGQSDQQAPISENASVPPENSNNPVKTAKVAIYNGTSIAGLAKKIQEQLASFLGVDVVKIGNAKGSYQKTTIVDVSGNNPEIASKLAEMLGGEVGSLPEKETAPEADILIIGGGN